MDARKTLIEEIRSLQDKIDRLEQASRYETIDYELLENLKDRQNVLMLEIENINVSNVENNREVWNVPMPTEKNIITDKKFNYELLGEITLISNRKTEFLEDIDISDAEMHRYIYEKGTNSILSNKEFLEEISGNKWDTIKRNLRKLAKCDNDVVSYCKDEKGRYYYKIMPYIVGDNGKLQYVTIDSRILEYLCKVYDSNAIKVYCVLLWLLWDSETQSYGERMITRSFMCKQIGLSESSDKNIKHIGWILKNFCNNKLLQRRSETITVEKKGETPIVKTVYYYSLPTIEEFINRTNYHVK